MSADNKFLFARKVPDRCLRCGKKRLVITVARNILVQCRDCSQQTKVLRPNDTDPYMSVGEIFGEDEKPN
jgi:transcription elongation factor Elf1